MKLMKAMKIKTFMLFMSFTVNPFHSAWRPVLRGVGFWLEYSSRPANPARLVSHEPG